MSSTYALDDRHADFIGLKEGDEILMTNRSTVMRFKVEEIDLRYNVAKCVRVHGTYIGTTVPQFFSLKDGRPLTYRIIEGKGTPYWYENRGLRPTTAAKLRERRRKALTDEIADAQAYVAELQKALIEVDEWTNWNDIPPIHEVEGGRWW